MNVKVWSDFRCPFCYIGKINLDKAIEMSGKDINVEMMSYELDPTYEPTPGQSYVNRLAVNIGTSEREAQLRINHIAQMAKNVGLNYDFENMMDVNSFKIHRVFQVAKQAGKGNEFYNLGMSAYFEHGRDISDEKLLKELASQVGITSQQVDEALTSPKIADLVRQEEQQAHQIGVKGVPYFLIDDQVFVSGAQAPESYVEAFEYVLKLNPNNDLSCTDESCVV